MRCRDIVRKLNVPDGRTDRWGRCNISRPRAYGTATDSKPFLPPMGQGGVSKLSFSLIGESSSGYHGYWLQFRLVDQTQPKVYYSIVIIP